MDPSQKFRQIDTSSQLKRVFSFFVNPQFTTYNNRLRKSICTSPGVHAVLGPLLTSGRHIPAYLCKSMTADTPNNSPCMLKYHFEECFG